MVRENCFRLGVISSTHGIKGDLVCYIDADDPARYSNLEEVYIAFAEKLVPYAVQGIKLNGTRGMLHLTGIDSLTDAESFRGCELLLPLTQLPDPGEQRFYIHEAFGFEVHDKTHGLVGRLHGIVEMPGAPLGQIKQEGKIILVPMVKEILDKIDRENKRLYVNLPEGLLELYH